MNLFTPERQGKLYTFRKKEDINRNKDINRNQVGKHNREDQVTTLQKT